MHIPDGFLSLPIALIFWIASIAIIAMVFRNTKKHSLIKKERIPLVAATTLLVFALQLLNFPILSGTTGHFVGGVLLAVLFGFESAVISMASILFVQAFVFHDGGVLALGANIFNMGIIAPFIGIKAKQLLGDVRGLFAGSIAGTLAAAILAAVQIGLSGSIALIPAVISMAYYYSFIGLAEGAIAVIVLLTTLYFVPILTVNRTEVVN